MHISLLVHAAIYFVFNFIVIFSENTSCADVGHETKLRAQSCEW